jgi:hypothetical protein
MGMGDASVGEAGKELAFKDLEEDDLQVGIEEDDFHQIGIEEDVVCLQLYIICKRYVVIGC